MSWRLRTRALPLDSPLLMGIVNATPDSFSDGGLFGSPQEAVDHARQLVADGADLVDVGGESTRPGASPVSVDEELDRVIPIVEALNDEGVIVSIDTSKPTVAVEALKAGAEIVNDVTGFRDLAMREVAVEWQPGVVIMHMAGTPRTMQDNPDYTDVLAEVGGYLIAQAGLLEAAGLSPERICIDPGLGFGKTTEHNLELLSGTGVLAGLGYPLMVGASRKRFISALLGVESLEERDFATAVLSAVVTHLGANVLRVHNVRLSRQAALLSSAIVADT
ncbi:MAG: dihydropteroate synthase [Acidimicrobiia bacterium]|nr:dihydropteroate synthase [Acidimicrobiia bacterium]MDH5504777.1 dihydropteroate synthase [Acidimicrobiia bacterium]